MYSIKPFQVCQELNVENLNISELHYTCYIGLAFGCKSGNKVLFMSSETVGLELIG